MRSGGEDETDGEASLWNDQDRASLSRRVCECSSSLRECQLIASLLESSQASEHQSIYLWLEAGLIGSHIA